MQRNSCKTTHGSSPLWGKVKNLRNGSNGQHITAVKSKDDVYTSEVTNHANVDNSSRRGL